MTDDSKVRLCLLILLQLFQPLFAALLPCVQLGNKRINRAGLVMEVAVNGHPLALFPTLDCGHVAMEMIGNFLPGVQSSLGRLNALE
jgi:hypothetical protein